MSGLLLYGALVSYIYVRNLIVKLAAFKDSVQIYTRKRDKGIFDMQVFFSGSLFLTNGDFSVAAWYLTHELDSCMSSYIL